MNLVHFLSSIGEYEMEKTRKLIIFIHSLNSHGNQITYNPRHIKTDREVILFERTCARRITYQTHALLMAPLVFVFFFLLIDIVHTDVQASYEGPSTQQSSQTQTQELSADSNASPSAVLSPDLITQAPIPELFQPINTPATPTPPVRVIPTAVPVVVAPQPSNFMDTYHAAGDKYGIPWQILYGLHMTETGGRDGAIMNYQGSGARGPLQFMPGTWRAYGVDGNGDGVADIDNAVDSIFGAAHYLSVHGTLDQALTYYGTNKARVYAIARSMGWSG